MADNNPIALFETERLLVRRITPDDRDALFSVYSDAGAMRFVGDGTPITTEQCDRWVEVTLANYASRGYGMSAMVLKRGSSVIGFCGIVHPGGQATPEIKYALLSEHWGHGYATETVAAMLRYGAKTLGLDRIIATIHADNALSERVLLKVGMEHSDTLDHNDGTLTKVFEIGAQKTS